MRKLFFSLIILLASSSALAIELQEALTKAYTSHEELKVIRLNFLNEIEQFPQALAEFMPRVSGEISSADTKTKSRFNSTTNKSEAQRWEKTLNISQPIFNGGGSVARLKAAQSAFKASRSSYYAQEQKILFDEITAYLECYATKQKYEISETSVNANKKQLEAVEERFKLGESTEIDMASAKANLAAAVTQKLNNYANYQVARTTFIRIFGVEPTDISIPKVPDKLPKTLEELMQKAEKANPNLLSIQHAAKGFQAGELGAKASLLPQVSFRLQANKEFLEPQTLLQPKSSSQNITSSVSVQIPILAQGGAEYSAVRQAKNKTRSAVIQVENQKKLITAQCASGWEAFKATEGGIEASAQAVAAAEIAYNGTLQEELVGTKTILDVLAAEERLYKSRVTSVEAETQHILSAFQLRALMGQLTAKSLQLKVPYFTPEQEFKKLKLKIIGT